MSEKNITGPKEQFAFIEKDEPVRTEKAQEPKQLELGDGRFHVTSECAGHQSNLHPESKNERIRDVHF